jgi:hypothetical protein
VSWDLHGDNLMRTREGRIVVMDPFTPKFWVHWIKLRIKKAGLWPANF